MLSAGLDMPQMFVPGHSEEKPQVFESWKKEMCGISRLAFAIALLGQVSIAINCCGVKSTKNAGTGTT